MNPIEQSPLGKTTNYISQYSPSLLYAIPRHLSRAKLGLNSQTSQTSQTQLPFHGSDIWTAYELSWLEPSGKPIVMLAKFTIPAHSPNIIESKSFKLYLNSYNQTHFSSTQQVQTLLTQDLSQAAGAPVKVQLYSLDSISTFAIAPPQGLCIDTLNIQTNCYDNPTQKTLKIQSTTNPNTNTHTNTNKFVSEHLYTNLLKSNCPVTGQPDWATLCIHYQANCALDHASLLQYIISFRQHADFHEHCVERIFIDLQILLAPQELTVYARYTRRGGLDINPYRSLSPDLNYPDQRLVRQ